MKTSAFFFFSLSVFNSKIMTLYNNTKKFPYLSLICSFRCPFTLIQLVKSLQDQNCYGSHLHCTTRVLPEHHQSSYLIDIIVASPLDRSDRGTYIPSLGRARTIKLLPSDCPHHWVFPYKNDASSSENLNVRF
jgi:hypothetical protein